MTERLNDACKPAFARHETFHPRYGWFRKAVEAAERNVFGGDSFNAEDATVELGVGKNMVHAIRMWGGAAKLLTEQSDAEKRHGQRMVPSLNGLALFGKEHGVDPYLEFPGTLWVLHWWMLRPTSQLPVWWLAFQRFGAVEFSEEDLLHFVVDEIERAGWRKPSDSSIRKDVSCLLRMYSATAQGKTSIDDLLDCPMRDLGLLEPAWGERHRYRFQIGPKPSLPDLVLLYTCLDWMASEQSSSRTASVNRLAHAVGGPGRAFRLTETDMTSSLERAVAHIEGAQMSSSAGAPTLSCVDAPKDLASRVLAKYYKSLGVKNTKSFELGEQAATAKLRPMRSAV